MSKGIREFTSALFFATLPERGTITDKQFRRKVIDTVTEQFGISRNSACTAYQFTFSKAKAEFPDLVVGLGRPPEKCNGGRKRKAVIVAEAVATLLGPMPDEQLSFTVKRKSDDTVVATEQRYEDARDMINKAAAQKKAKLYFV